jgi:hypothetical protein
MENKPVAKKFHAAKKPKTHLGEGCFVRHRRDAATVAEKAPTDVDIIAEVLAWSAGAAPLYCSIWLFCAGGVQ